MNQTINIHNEQIARLIRDSYSCDEIKQIEAFLRAKGTFRFPRLNNNLFPAADVRDDTWYTGYGNAWIRDNVYVAFAHWLNGDHRTAVRAMKSLMLQVTKQRGRFEDIIRGDADPKDPMSRPHVRLNGCQNGEIEQQWSHAQNDALGYFLWLYAKLINERLIRPDRQDLLTLALFPRYFYAIRFWNDEDSGHWEETPKISASSIGVVLGGLREYTDMIQRLPERREMADAGLVVDTSLLSALIEHGQHALDVILPADCDQADPDKSRRYDAALLFLVFPMNIVNDDMGDQIVRDVISQLEGECGIRRYRGDSYWCQDYRKLVAPEQRSIDYSRNIKRRNELLQEGHEAQWCIFDPIVSSIYGKEFQQTGSSDFLELQVHYLNRSLGQITGFGGRFEAFKCPELYSHEDGRCVPSDATPLLWTQANLLVALKVMRDSLNE